MHNRILGHDLQVSAIGYGCMGLSQSYLPVPTREEGVALIRDAVDRGITFFDTAEVYGPFTNEQIVGAALAPSVSRSSSPPNSVSHLTTTDSKPVCRAARNTCARQSRVLRSAWALTTSTCSTSTESTPMSRSRTPPARWN